MKDQIVTLKVAELAKQKGFDLPCNYRYSLISKDLKYTIIAESLSDITLPRRIRMCLAPTQALLQRWLREKHKLHPYINPTGSFDEWHIPNIRDSSIGALSSSRDQLMDFPGCYSKSFPSYEDALEYALYYCLDYIK